MTTKLVKKDSEFSEILDIICKGRTKAYRAVNTALIETYWAVGGHLSRKVIEAGWGKGVVRELAEWLVVKAPDLKGFSASNLWRMKQFYETYADSPKLASLLRVSPWTRNLLTLRQNQREQNACSRRCPSATVSSKNTPQGYARKRTLKPGGSLFCAPQSGWRDRVRGLLTGGQLNPASMGFPADWETRPVWNQKGRP
ncbi:MAG: DUF1016 N-terminal domain-containing protein [Acidobacteriota bacterium]